MYKKSFILGLAVLFALFILSSFTYANSEDVKNAITNVTDTMVDGTTRLVDDVRSGVGSAENGIENMLDMNNKDNTRTVENTNDDGLVQDTMDYTTTRTTADMETTNNSNLWVWAILAIAAVVIIGLVWYYGMQNTTHRD